VLVALLSGLWGLANPPFAAPDEPAHVIRAVALAHGELTGESPSRHQVQSLGLTDRKDYLVVRAPKVYATASNAACFVRKSSITASCLRFGRATRDIEIGTYVGRHPPAYYALVGSVSWVVPPGSGTVYLMRMIGALITAAFAATAIHPLRKSTAPGLVAAGLALAITPMVLFLSSTVNPSSPEIAASIAVWVCGLLLICKAGERVDKRLVTAVGIAGCVLAVSRQLGPLWLALIALAMLGVSNRSALHNLARSSWARLWALLIVACSLVQVGWDVIVKPLDVTRSGNAPPSIDTVEVLRISFGKTFSRYREMIGSFGWLDTPVPALTWIPWTILIGLLVLIAVLWATRRQAAVLLALLAATIIVPVAVEAPTYADAGTLTWQGRYTLPFAVGIPILAAVLLSSTERGRRLAGPRLLSAFAVVFSGAHIIAFAQNQRRYAVGYDGEIQFWKHAQWSPPVSSLLLTLVFAIIVVAFAWWLLVIVPRGAAQEHARTRRREDRIHTPKSAAVITSPSA